MTVRGALRAIDTRPIERLAAGAGLLCVAWCAVSLLATASYQRETAHAFDTARIGAASPARPGAHARRHARSPGSPGPIALGRLEIPRARVRAMIATGVDARTLSLAVGRVPGTALPGGRGRMVLAGHRDTFFRGLGDLRPGDAIRVTTASGTYAYRVTSTSIVAPSQVSALRRGPDPGLAIVTCYPFRFVGPAPMRYVVYAAAVRPAAKRG